MVSLWPWKGSNTSPAEFEKTLSTLSAKISGATARLDTHRQRSRRYRVLWTLYTSFAYILYSIIITLVLGWQYWGAVEYFAVVGGPVLIYAIRLGLDKYYHYRISGTQKHLEELHKQRDATIEKLKEATKYNSTQQLLEKYGGDFHKRSGSQKGAASGQGSGGPSGEKRGPKIKTLLSHPISSGRTGIPPPPTANIPRPQPDSLPTTPIRSPPMSDQRGPPGPSNLNSTPYLHNPVQWPPETMDEFSFTPNMLPTAQQQNYNSLQPHWYDRILDVLLGEDETLAKNRLALICTHCRLVNGQAAPGVRTLQEIGRWRCGSCGTWNGQESETKKVLSGIQEAESAVETDSSSRSRSGKTFRSWNRSQDNPSVVLEQSASSGFVCGTEGAWEPISGKASVTSEIDSGNFSAGEGTDASMLVAPTSSDGEEGESCEEGEGGKNKGVGIDKRAEVKVEEDEDKVDNPGLRKRVNGQASGKIKGGWGIEA
ncbi:hypothetical protein PAAG_01587 [Paracoccidioides lutzii Pb01]|uniref:Endoplasmic reticulum junction formation protein lunapark n=1 Tax=Paracoccidioides lutzii (strain ATCC MYA-826 / Pb01) TaxID=502779 RepID=C1GSU2_PARBA|nr:hypothetical protein PAAG_01587 [Paracoccidioides lutzii Pb01]EEH39125.2 hypothetical protein PAAG_01587 [Paracoccidioides lutzii Pb01]